VLGDDGDKQKPTHYGYQLFGCEVGIRFPTVKILDYASQSEGLLEDPDLFAVIDWLMRQPIELEQRLLQEV